MGERRHNGVQCMKDLLGRLASDRLVILTRRLSTHREAQGILHVHVGGGGGGGRREGREGRIGWRDGGRRGREGGRRKEGG